MIAATALQSVDLTLASEAPPANLAYFVSPSGSDDGPGTLEKPFATLPRALQATRKSGERTIHLLGGTYWLDKPVELTPEDSKLTLDGWQSQRVTISGGRRIAGWHETIKNGKRLWTADLPEVRDGKWNFHQLWVNGRRAVRARFPHSGYLAIEKGVDPISKPEWKAGQTEFVFKEGDLKGVQSIAGADLVIMNRWVDSHLPVLHVDEGTRTIACGKRSVFHVDPGDLYYLEGAQAFLTSPGDWYLDCKTGTLYYLPLLDETAATADAVAPRLAACLTFKGDPHNGRFVEHVTVSGLSFSHTEWYFPPDFKPGWPNGDIGGFSQASVGLPAAVSADGIRYCTFTHCNFENLGSYALELGRACQHNRVTHSDFSDLAGGGIKIGETCIRANAAEQTSGNEVRACRIHDGGRIFHSAIGVWIGQSASNSLCHNEIYDFYYSGISIGWTWGYGPSLANGNRIENNDVHHIGRLSSGDGPILSDMGGIYTLGKQPGTVIRNNRWHDIAAIRYGGWGIYFDEGSSDILAENNLVYNTTHGGFHQHYGKDNLVRNNIFAFGRDMQMQRTRAEDHNSFTFEHNIVYGEKGPVCTGELADNNYRFDGNLYWMLDQKPPVFSKLAWEDWRKQGQDTHSRIADPRFSGPTLRRFELKKNSPVAEIGFQPFDQKNFGPRDQE